MDTKNNTCKKLKNGYRREWLAHLFEVQAVENGLSIFKIDWNVHKLTLTWLIFKFSIFLAASREQCIWVLCDSFIDTPESSQLCEVDFCTISTRTYLCIQDFSWNVKPVARLRRHCDQSELIQSFIDQLSVCLQCSQWLAISYRRRA